MFYYLHSYFKYISLYYLHYTVWFLMIFLGGAALPRRVEAVVAAKGGDQLNINVYVFIMQCHYSSRWCNGQVSQYFCSYSVHLSFKMSRNSCLSEISMFSQQPGMALK